MVIPLPWDTIESPDNVNSVEPAHEQTIEGLPEEIRIRGDTVM
jgi:hypothetical protein